MRPRAGSSGQAAPQALSKGLVSGVSLRKAQADWIPWGPSSPGAEAELQVSLGKASQRPPLLSTCLTPTTGFNPRRVCAGVTLSYLDLRQVCPQYCDLFEPFSKHLILKKGAEPSTNARSLTYPGRATPDAPDHPRSLSSWESGPLGAPRLPEAGAGGTQQSPVGTPFACERPSWARESETHRARALWTLSQRTPEPAPNLLLHCSCGWAGPLCPPPQLPGAQQPRHHLGACQKSDLLGQNLQSHKRPRNFPCAVAVEKHGSSPGDSDWWDVRCSLRTRGPSELCCLT